VGAETLHFIAIFFRGLTLCSVHPFAKKEWYNVLVPGFDKRVITLTPCNKSAGLVNAADNLRGRVFSTSLADCNNASEQASFRKVKFEINEIKGFDCYTNFHGMDITRDKSQSMMKKWHSTIEAFVQAKTMDGYILRIFAICFTKKTNKQVKATCFAKASHQKLIRKKMKEIMQSTIQKNSLKDLVKVFVKEEIGAQIQKECSKIFPLEDNCLVRKVKILKKPKFDLTKLMELYKEKVDVEKTATKNKIEA